MRNLGLSLLAGMFLFCLILRGNYALKPERPKDMPAVAQFVQSGYDVERNEPEGSWVACGLNTDGETNWCRVTTPRGTVMYEGAFLPTHGSRPLNRNEIGLARIHPDHLWVQGPAEGIVVPVIPLSSGGFLVPADDREAFQDRWTSHPEELQEISTVH